MKDPTYKKPGNDEKDILLSENSLELREQLEIYTREKEILLHLSNEITKVREKDDLIRILSSVLKGYFYFTHAVISLIDHADNSYYAFLIDKGSLPIRHREELPSLLKTKFVLGDPFLQQISESEFPVSFTLDSIIDQPGIPDFVKINYQCGVKAAMIVRLTSQTQTIGYIFIYSDVADSFTDEFKNIMHRIGPHVSNAVTNITINQEIHHKEQDNAFLLEFSHEIAKARTKDELNLTIHEALKKLGSIKAYFIRIINADGRTMSPFIHDNDIFYRDHPDFQELLATRIPVNTALTAKVLRGDQPVQIDFEEEVRNGHTDHYIEFWKKLGSKRTAFRKMTGISLKFGETVLGVIWIITDQIDRHILDGICAQITVAIANILSNEEIAQREEEKSKLLLLSDEIAGIRSRNDLLIVVHNKLRVLFSINDIVLTQINEDRLTYSPFVLDVGEKLKHHPQYKEVTSANYSITDPIFSKVAGSVEPVIMDARSLVAREKMPAYVHLWNSLGVSYVVGTALRVGGKSIGCAFMHLNDHQAAGIKINLLKAICSQLAVAVSNIMANEQIQAYRRLLEVENDHLREQLENIYNFSDIIGSGQAMQKVYKMVSLVAHSNSTTLLLGETGTGKELIARAIHSASPRKNKLMVKVNCAALPANLIESELFGHEKGSFTGAMERRIGKFELANNSTLFLDEIGEMPLETQVKLLRVIQERELERVGGSTTIQVDVRIIAATNRDLEEEVKAGRFRPDLYYRLNVFPIILPPLRERLEDLEDLVAFFLRRYSKNTGRKVTAITPKVLHELRTYSWPGNVRELEHLIERSILLTEGNVLREIQLPHTSNRDELPSLRFTNMTLEELERSYIIDILRRCNGRIAGNEGAALLLNLPATTLHSKINKLGISKEEYYSSK